MLSCAGGSGARPLVPVGGSSGALPPPGFLSLPFPLGEAWTFDGVHDWNEAEGSGPMSSVDFFKLGGPEPRGGCGDNLLTWDDDLESATAWVTAVADGTLRTVRQPDTGEPIPCWAELEHAGGWRSWYYHVEAIQADEDGTFVRRGQRVAKLASTRRAAECAGGDARSHPHLHLSLLANASFVKLHQAQFSHWVLQAGECSYDCRCQHSYASLAVQPTCRRCPFCPLPHTSTAECPAEPCDPTARCGCGCGGGGSAAASSSSPSWAEHPLSESAGVHEIVGSDDYADPDDYAEPAPRGIQQAESSGFWGMAARRISHLASGEDWPDEQALVSVQHGLTSDDEPLAAAPTRWQRARAVARSRATPAPEALLPGLPGGGCLRTDASCLRADGPSGLASARLLSNQLHDHVPTNRTADTQSNASTLRADNGAVRIE